HGGEHHYLGSAGWVDERDARHVAGPNAGAVFDGQRRPFAEEVLRCGAPEVPHSVEEYDFGGAAGGNRGQCHADRSNWKNGEHRYAAGFCDCLAFRNGVAIYESLAAAAVSDSVGAVGADSGCYFEWLHDVQAGLGELGSADYLADRRTRRVFHLQREAQPGAGVERRRAVSVRG